MRQALDRERSSAARSSSFHGGVRLGVRDDKRCRCEGKLVARQNDLAPPPPFSLRRAKSVGETSHESLHGSNRRGAVIEIRRRREGGKK